MGFKVESPQSMRNRNTQDNFLKGISKAITEFADVKAERTKLEGDIMVNNLKAKQNFFWKLQEQEAENNRTKKMMEEDNQRQNSWLGGEGDTQTQVPEVFDLPITPELRVGAGGKATPYYPKAPEFWAKRIQQKEKRFAETGDKRFALTPREQELKKRMIGGAGLGSGGVTKKQVLDLAIKLAENENGQATAESIKKQIPNAQQMLSGTDFGTSQEGIVDQYSPEQEQKIKDNMEAYGKSREEIIQALTSRNLL
jgi:hypothetical protein